MFRRAANAFGIAREPTLRTLLHRLETVRAERERALREVDGLLVENFELLREVYRLRQRVDYLTNKQGESRAKE